MQEIKMNEVVWKNALAALGEKKLEDFKTVADLAQTLTPYFHMIMPPVSQEPELKKELEEKQAEIEKLKAKIEKLTPEKPEK